MPVGNSSSPNVARLNPNGINRARWFIVNCSLVMTMLEFELCKNNFQCHKTKIWAFVVAFILSFVLLVPSSVASPDVTEVTVHLGNSANELKFFPSNFEFKVGQRYKLILDNPSPQKHYFTAKDFADAAWTAKVEAGKVEIKGAIKEVELKPGAIAEWVFVPMKPGKYNLRCPIAGHAEAGMTGAIAVVSN